MANIDFFNKQIDAAIYGEEARSPIRSSLQVINEESEEIFQMVEDIFNRDGDGFE